jgi:hypothetical protein
MKIEILFYIFLLSKEDIKFVYRCRIICKKWCKFIDSFDKERLKLLFGESKSWKEIVSEKEAEYKLYKAIKLRKPLSINQIDIPNILILNIGQFKKSDGLFWISNRQSFLIGKILSSITCKNKIWETLISYDKTDNIVVTKEVYSTEFINCDNKLKSYYFIDEYTGKEIRKVNLKMRYIYFSHYLIFFVDSEYKIYCMKKTILNDSTIYINNQEDIIKYSELINLKYDDNLIVNENSYGIVKIISNLNIIYYFNEYGFLMKKYFIKTLSDGITFDNSSFIVINQVFGIASKLIFEKKGIYLHPTDGEKKLIIEWEFSDSLKIIESGHKPNWTYSYDIEDIKNGKSYHFRICFDDINLWININQKKLDKLISHYFRINKKEFMNGNISTKIIKNKKEKIHYNRKDSNDKLYYDNFDLPIAGDHKIPFFPSIPNRKLNQQLLTSDGYFSIEQYINHEERTFKSKLYLISLNQNYIVTKVQKFLGKK